MKTKKEYIDDYLAEAQPGHEAIVKKRKETDATLKSQIGATVDASAAAAAGVYQQEIEQAPLDSRALYDQNAMREAIDRKQIRESLANMGMTDSGLSGSMNTALTIQRSRADNSVRAAEQQRIRAAESAIDQIYANAEAEKAKQGIAIDQATANWENQAYTDMHNAAITAGANAYVADVDAENKRLEREQNERNAAIDRAETLKGNRISIAQNHIGRGVDSFEAWGQAYRSYPDAETAEGQLYAYYNQLRDQGYDTPYAKAMATAYMNTIAAGGTQAQATQAVQAAYTRVKTEEENAALLKKQQEDALIEQANAAALLKQQQEAATAKTKRDNEIYDARVKLAQSYIGDGMDDDEAWAMAYRAYPDTSTAEGYQYAVYNQLKGDGYDNRYAKAMSSAFAGAMASGGTPDQANAAMGDAMVAEAEKEIESANLDGFVDRLAELSAPKATAGNVQANIRYYTNRYEKEGLSDFAVGYAVAQRIGEKYQKTVKTADDATVEKIKKELVSAFDGTFLNLVMVTAGFGKV